MGLLGTVNKGAEVASGVIGLAKQLGVGRKKAEKRADERQLRQQEALSKLAVKNNKEMLDYQKQKDLEMWEATNWKAQMEQAEKAGLSKAWLMSKGGGGSASMGGSGTGISGGNASDSASTENAETNRKQLGIQQMMQMAQIENLKANTEKTKAEAEKTAGVDTETGRQGIEESKARIASLTQGIENAKAQEALTRAQTVINELDGKLKELSMEDSLDLIEFTARKAGSEAETAFSEAYVSGKTKETKIQMMQTELIGATLRNALTKAQTAGTYKGIELSDAQIKKMSEDIAQGWKGLEQQQESIALDRFKKTVEANSPSLMNVIGSQIDGAINSLFAIGGKSRRNWRKPD